MMAAFLPFFRFSLSETSSQSKAQASFELEILPGVILPPPPLNLQVCRYAPPSLDFFS